MGYAEIPAQMWAWGEPSPGAVDGALERSVSCARIVDAVRVFSAGRIFSQNLHSQAWLSTPEYPAAAGGRVLKVPAQVWAG